MQFFIGRSVKIRTGEGDEFEGEIFAIDVGHTDSLMLRDKAGNFHWLKTAIVRDIRATDRHHVVTNASDLAGLPPLDWSAIAEREKRADQAERQRQQSALKSS